MKNIPFSIISIIALSSIYVIVFCSQSRKMTEEQNAEISRKMAYDIIIKSIVEYKQKYPETQSFEDFLKLEWPQDYKHFKTGMRSYEEWEVLYNSN